MGYFGRLTLIVGFLTLTHLPRSSGASLQRTLQPTQHMAATWLKQVVDLIRLKFVPAKPGRTPRYPTVYAEVRKALLDPDQTTNGAKTELVAAVDKLIGKIARTLADKIELRTEPYMAALQVFELIDPSFKDFDNNSIDDAIEAEGIKLCNRFSQGGVALDWDQVVSDLGEIRVAFSGCTQTDSENCSKNLLRFYRQWHQAGKMERWPQASEFIRCVFCCPITTVKVESMFSIMNYNKSGSRCRMADDTVCAVVQLKDLTNPLADPNCKKGYGARAALNETKALEHDLPPTFRRGGASSAL